MVPCRQDRFPGLVVPELPVDAASGEEPDRIDNRRATVELGLHLTPIESTLADMAATMISMGVATPAISAVRDL